MRQLISLVTLGVDDLARSRRFYVDGFGWKSIFETPEIIFYQMNGLVFSTWLRKGLDADTQRSSPVKSAGFALAHNVEREQGLGHVPNIRLIFALSSAPAIFLR